MPRPDVNLAVSLVGRYKSNPGMEHWTAVKNILKYLKRTTDMFLVYGGDEELVVKGYVDASFDTDLDDFKSQTRIRIYIEWWSGHLERGSSIYSMT